MSADDAGIEDGPSDSGIEAVRLVTIALGFDDGLDIQVDPGLAVWQLKGIAADLMDFARSIEEGDEREVE